jgi:uncharacterized membrane protein YhdT
VRAAGRGRVPRSTGFDTCHSQPFLDRWETRRSTRLCFGSFLAFYSVLVSTWIMAATPSFLPWVWSTSNGDIMVLCLNSRCADYAHENSLEELASWLMMVSCTLNIVFIVVLPRMIKVIFTGLAQNAQLGPAF